MPIRDANIRDANGGFPSASRGDAVISRIRLLGAAALVILALNLVAAQFNPGMATSSALIFGHGKMGPSGLGGAGLGPVDTGYNLGGAQTGASVPLLRVAQRSTSVSKTRDVSSPEEAAHRAKMDKVVAPVRNVSLSRTDATNLLTAIKSLRKKNTVTASAAQSLISNPIARKIVTWYRLRFVDSSPIEMRAFLDRNPDWPNRTQINRKLEQALFEKNDSGLTRKLLVGRKPETAAGYGALALERLGAGDTQGARKLAAHAWRNEAIDKDFKKPFLKRFGKLLSAGDHKFRRGRLKIDANWSKQRRRAYEALDARKPKRAYALITSAGPLSINPLNAQQFIAGWIALRYLGDTQSAISHFSTMVKNADGPLSRSKSAYWLGRAYEAAGKKDLAKQAYKRATARQFDTFHAMLARLKLSPRERAISITPSALPTSEQARRFQSNEVALAAGIVKRAKLGTFVMRQFTVRLALNLKTEAEVAMAAHLAQSMGDTQQALRIAKNAIARGMNLVYYAYPLHAFPDYKPLRKPPETAFLLGIARQESEFNTLTLSHAGARGILQVMPITAKHVCRDYKIKCQIKRLMSDESYNTMIASAYTADRMGEFGGSYVLGLSGYNAGPGRTRQWIKRFGDPRDGRIDPLDWIERMPYQETRRYVAKVLTNIQMYRARLGQASNALRLDKDLKRAQRPVPAKRKLIAPGARR